MRFPEFEGEWESKPLREVVKINQGLQIAISERSTENKTGSYFYITNEFLKAGSGKKYYILNPPQSVICTEKDILMTRTGNTGQVVTNVSGAFHNNFFKVAYPEYIDKIFLYNFLKLNKTQNQILRFAGTSTIPDLNHSDFYRIVISFPSNIEQEKISSFLSMIDERIQAQSKIINDLKTLKTATAKKIFSQEFRFKDDKGNDFSEWEKILLGEVMSIPEKTKAQNIDKNKLLTVKLHLKGVLKNDNTDTLSFGATNYFIRKKGQFIYGKQNLFNGAFDIIPDEFDGFLSSGDVPTLEIKTLSRKVCK
ncbi:restriction endonuclease subunit S [Candidatus Chryseobacterium massiliense]|uniref:restriction endonuclease subunit S n=1 Tax=Candidatus Chryseobacterium massiliense TaxID=204089 RepID=UPI001300A670|nr:restriction endonuclease subunit S [Candidatus Chryseobacterium massiliae]